MSPTLLRVLGYRFFFFRARKHGRMFMSTMWMERPRSGWTRIPRSPIVMVSARNALLPSFALSGSANMKSEKHGGHTAVVGVTHISEHGFRLQLANKAPQRTSGAVRDQERKKPRRGATRR